MTSVVVTGSCLPPDGSLSPEGHLGHPIRDGRCLPTKQPDVSPVRRDGGVADRIGQATGTPDAMRGRVVPPHPPGLPIGSGPPSHHQDPVTDGDRHRVTERPWEMPGRSRVTRSQVDLLHRAELPAGDLSAEHVDVGVEPCRGGVPDTTEQCGDGARSRAVARA